MLFIILLAIILIPLASIVTIPGTIVWYPQVVALQFIGAIAFAANFWKLNKFISLFLIYLAFSYIYVTGAGQRTLLCLMIGYMAIAITLLASRLKQDDLRWAYRVLIGMSLLSIAYSFIQQYGYDPIFRSLDGGKEDAVSFMGSRNQLGIYSVANAFWATWLIPLSIIPMFFAKCNSSLIGLFVGSIVYFYFKFNKKVLRDLLIVGLILAIPWWHFCHKGGDEISERLNIWKLTVSQLVNGKILDCDLQGHRTMVQGNPLFGFGLGQFFVYSPFSQYVMWGLTATDGAMQKQNHFYEHAHNDAVEALYELGYIGFIIVMLCFSSVVAVFISSPKTPGVVLTFSSLVGQIVSSFSVYVFHAPVSLFMFCLVLGIFYAEVAHARTSKIS